MVPSSSSLIIFTKSWTSTQDSYHAQNILFTLALTWKNHDCLYWVLLPLSFKGRRGDAEHKGVWNPELPLSPVLLAVPCHHQSLGPCTLPSVLESVRQGASFQLCFLLLMRVSITSSQLHRRPLWRALGRATVEAREVSQ